MFRRILVSVDRGSSRLRSLVACAEELAYQHNATVRVLHVVEFAGRGCAAPLESVADAERLLEEAVFELRMSGVGADSVSRLAHSKGVDALIAEEATRWSADVIVLGSSVRRRLFGRDLRELVLQKTRLPVVVVPERPANVRAHSAQLRSH